MRLPAGALTSCLAAVLIRRCCASGAQAYEAHNAESSLLIGSVLTPLLASCGGGDGVLGAQGKVCCPQRCGDSCGIPGACAAKFPDSASHCCLDAILAQHGSTPCGTPPCIPPPSNPLHSFLTATSTAGLTSSGNAPHCKYEDERCGARWRPSSGDAYAPARVSPYTACCPLFQGTTCRATKLAADGTFGTRCAPFTECPDGRSACGSHTFALTTFGQSVEAVCCGRGEMCAADGGDAHSGTVCVARQACAEGKGETPCGRVRSADGEETADDTCCPAGKQCYIQDKADGGYTTQCGTCKLPCGRKSLDSKTGDDRCCLPKQVCKEAFHGVLPSLTTECVYPFRCSSDLCKNGGKCIAAASPYINHDKGHFKKCKCAPGFTGVFCDKSTAKKGATPRPSKGGGSGGKSSGSGGKSGGGNGKGGKHTGGAGGGKGKKKGKTPGKHKGSNGKNKGGGGGSGTGSSVGGGSTAAHGGGSSGGNGGGTSNGRRNASDDSAAGKRGGSLRESAFM